MEQRKICSKELIYVFLVLIVTGMILVSLYQGLSFV